MSHGSKAAGGGALTAFIGLSAARAEPVIASAVAAIITTFFMNDPHRLICRNQLWLHPVTGVPRQRLAPMFLTPCNLERARRRVKPKSDAFADFLGVWGVCRKV